MNQQPEFDSLEAFFAHHRSLVDAQSVEVAARAVAEAEAEGFTVDTDMEQQIAQRVRALLLEKLEEQYASLTNRLKG